MTTERVTNGSFCDEWTGWGHDTTDWEGYWDLYAGPDGWWDDVSCGAAVAIQADPGEHGMWQTVNFTGVTHLSFNAHLYIPIYYPGARFRVTIDGTPVYNYSTIGETEISPSVDVSGYTGNHVVKFSGNCLTGASIAFMLRSVSALASDLPPKPVAAFSGTPLSGNTPLSVVFTDASTNTPTSWLWDFGDGHLSAERNPTHIYTIAGVYTVDLTATNAGGSDMKTKTNYITVTEPPPPPPYVEPIWSLKIGPM